MAQRPSLRQNVTMESSPKITLDNNCIINLLDVNSSTATSVDELSEIVSLALSGVADIAITTRVEADLENDKDADRKAAFLKQVQMFPVIGTVARYGTSKLDGGDVYASDDSERLADDIQKIVFPGGLNKESSNYDNKLNDIDHLVGHAINQRDVFVTDDKAMLRKSAELKRAPGIVVMSPVECLTFLNDVVERNRKVPLQSKKAVAGYSSKNLQGRVTFDYTNNNGSFVIGEGLFLFETEWTTASDVAIYAYRDAPSIDSLAIAVGVATINQVGDAAAFDFSSRVRIVREGEVLIIQNVNGFYAAIKVLDVKVEDRGDEQDELTFEYAIQTDGTADFSSF